MKKRSYFSYATLSSVPVFALGCFGYIAYTLADITNENREVVYITEFKAATSNAHTLPNKVIGVKEKYTCHFGENEVTTYREDQKIPVEMYDIDTVNGSDATVRVSTRKFAFEHNIQRHVSKEHAPDFFKDRFNQAVAACATAKTNEVLGNQNADTWGAGE